LIASSVTSGPIPSPGITAILIANVSHSKKRPSAWVKETILAAENGAGERSGDESSASRSALGRQQKSNEQQEAN